MRGGGGIKRAARGKSHLIDITKKRNPHRVSQHRRSIGHTASSSNEESVLRRLASARPPEGGGGGLLP